MKPLANDFDYMIYQLCCCGEEDRKSDSVLFCRSFLQGATEGFCATSGAGSKWIGPMLLSKGAALSLLNAYPIRAGFEEFSILESVAALRKWNIWKSFQESELEDSGGSNGPR